MEFSYKMFKRKLGRVPVATTSLLATTNHYYTKSLFYKEELFFVTFSCFSHGIEVPVIIMFVEISPLWCWECLLVPRVSFQPVTDLYAYWLTFIYRHKFGNINVVWLLCLPLIMCFSGCTFVILAECKNECVKWPQRSLHD